MWELSDVRLRHPNAAAPALQHVDLTVMHGEHVVVLGSSGAGKSTLLRCLAGDLAPVAGTLTHADIDVYASPAARAVYQRDVAIIRQTGDLVPRLSARSNILLAVSRKWRRGDFLRVIGGRPTRFDATVNALADEHGVTHLLRTPVERLSGGERQRIALLQALMREPLLILADEPTNGLDPTTAQAALEALTQVRQVTLVVATHDLNVATAFPRMVALKHGRVVHDGPPLAVDALTALYATERTE